MTILQIKLALAINECGSISGAAKELEISQPNASNYLKVLEQELGFPIFHRSSAGIVSTPKGEQFLIYARQIAGTHDKALNLRNADELFRLRLGTVNYYAAAEPFFELCSQHRDDAVGDLCLYNVSISDGIQQVLHHKLDVVAVAVMKHQSVSLQRECKIAGLELHPICEIPAVLMLRKNHPAELDGSCMNITQGSDALKAYPYIGVRNLSGAQIINDYNDSDFVQCSYKVFVGDTNMRLRLIEATNGFGFGIQSSYRMVSQHAIDHFPVPGVSLELFCITLPDADKQTAVREYFKLLKREMSKLSV